MFVVTAFKKNKLWNLLQKVILTWGIESHKQDSHPLSRCSFVSVERAFATAYKWPHQAITQTVLLYFYSPASVWSHMTIAIDYLKPHTKNLLAILTMCKRLSSMTISTVVWTVFNDYLKLPMFSLISFFIYSSTYLSESLAWPDSLPRMLLINHQLINQQVQIVPTRWSRHSRSQLWESPGLSKILAWRTHVRTSQVPALWITLSDVHLLSQISPLSHWWDTSWGVPWPLRELVT